MGFKSYVKIAIPYQSVEELNNRIQNAIYKNEKIQNNKNIEYSYNLLDYAKIKSDRETYCIFSWDWVNFDINNIDVKILLDSLKNLSSYEYDYKNMFNIIVLREDGVTISQCNDNEDLPFLYVISEIGCDEYYSAKSIDLNEIIQRPGRMKR